MNEELVRIIISLVTVVTGTGGAIFAVWCGLQLWIINQDPVIRAKKIVGIKIPEEDFYTMGAVIGILTLLFSPTILFISGYL